MTPESARPPPRVSATCETLPASWRYAALEASKLKWDSTSRFRTARECLSLAFEVSFRLAQTRFERALHVG